MTTTPHVLWIDDPEAPGNRLLGGKFGSLADMHAARFEVPPGFGITTGAYRRFLDAAGLTRRAEEARSQAANAELSEIREISAGLTAEIESAPLPPELETAVCEAYAELGTRSGQVDVPVAVRSSGESEDLAGASFAGQYDTFLWIRGVEELLRHVRRCWAGMFGEAVLTYRTEDEKPPPSDLGICVGVQQMVAARSAGVMFTLDPVSGDRSKVVVEGCWGLGEGVVSGGITPSRYRVDKVTFEVLDRDIVEQESKFAFDPGCGEVALVEVADELRSQPCVTDEQLHALAELAKRIERHRGAPQDIEWAVGEHGEVRVLQVRPETVWSRRGTEQLVGDRKSPVDRVLARFAGQRVVRGSGGA
ncbi:pyruvate, water dikinase [Prauserella aidingensis]|uniref:PEP/pyruvate-binding domain-containing protein n=1 Tax=Prauserella aidingensis TaxID=387890 RepID=UPI0020A24065|nr:PEP/pyruvate-binding domain-containing protein [Prauserella aidingensis]MCP2251574.1 pyruvate, water dikinase [Prauserella aidingensis]